MSSTENPLANLSLDASFYKPSAQEVEFFKNQTGIQEDEELKDHIITVQKEAWAVGSSYFCVVYLTLILNLGQTVPLHSCFQFHQVYKLIYTIPSVVKAVYRLGITLHPLYKDLLKLGKERPGAIFLELGCCCKNFELRARPAVTL